MNKLLILLILISQNIFGQINYLNEGNKYLNENKNIEAEKIFREGIKSDNSNLTYKCQLALSLINQKRHTEAESEIKEVLIKDSLNIGALWYGGINNFTSDKPNFRKSVNYFEKAYPHINKSSQQYFAVNYFIGKCYKNLLYTEGVSYKETDRMLETYKKYVELQPNAQDVAETKYFIAKVESKRPPANVKKWVIATNEEKVNELVKQEMGTKK
ncbi:M48 family metallopeptidase [Flavobacterium sp. MDT1-60]|uniref:tetratricopeptide repeat protein n=1 Tax=Flavobacterium sp. MDT1-60 TaxID=1979344 RepID=UPI00177F9B50|nr:hypothetical protein [Flavobacterium sp. MDT1-60]QOG02034.1 hypothetical protein IHE43_19870 [Flavobacterium sp. MDT1-60]